MNSSELRRLAEVCGAQGLEVSVRVRQLVTLSACTGKICCTAQYQAKTLAAAGATAPFPPTLQIPGLLSRRERPPQAPHRRSGLRWQFVARSGDAPQVAVRDLSEATTALGQPLLADSGILLCHCKVSALAVRAVQPCGEEVGPKVNYWDAALPSASPTPRILRLFKWRVKRSSFPKSGRHDDGMIWCPQVAPCALRCTSFKPTQRPRPGTQLEF